MDHRWKRYGYVTSRHENIVFFGQNRKIFLGETKKLQKPNNALNVRGISKNQPKTKPLVIEIIT